MFAGKEEVEGWRGDDDFGVWVCIRKKRKSSVRS